MPSPSRRITTARPLDMAATLAPLRHGGLDPAYRTAQDGTVWRATLVASGSATLSLKQVGPQSIDACVWGDGADEVWAGLPALLGELDDIPPFDPVPGPVRDAYRRYRNVRVPRSGRVLEALIPTILEQRVITRTAHDAWRWLLMAYGAPAPGPAPHGLRVPPAPHQWATIPSWDFHRAGVDPSRAHTVVLAAQHARRLEQVTDLTPAEAQRILQLIPGVGPWTSARTVQTALGDADTVTVGDYHLPGQIGWALTGRRGADDTAMLALLEPYRPHRHRAVRHLLLSGTAREPRRAPRLSIQDHRAN